MSSAETATERLARSMNRFDVVTGYLAESAARQVRADAAEAEQERRERARRWDESCVKHASRYDEVFQKFGERAPARIADESPAKYRRRMFDSLRRKLPDGHELADVDPKELTSDLIEKFEQMLFEAAERESETPSGKSA
jgi:hypothetical protein